MIASNMVPHLVRGGDTVRPSWRSLILLAEWVVYLLCAMALVHGAVWMAGQIASLTGTEVGWQTDGLKTTVGAVTALVFSIMVCWHAWQDIVRLRGKGERGRTDG